MMMMTRKREANNGQRNEEWIRRERKRQKKWRNGRGEGRGEGRKRK